MTSSYPDSPDNLPDDIESRSEPGAGENFDDRRESGELAPNPSPPTARTSIRRRPGYPMIAWLVILGMTLFSAGVFSDDPPPENNGESGMSAQLTIMELQARYFIGATQAAGVDSDMLLQQVDVLNRGTYRERLCFVILEGELAGPERAARSLARLNEQAADAGLELSETDADLARTLDRLYGDFAAERWTAPSLVDSERAELQGVLGWFGTLALNPREVESAERTRIEESSLQTMTIALGGFAALTVVGLFGLLSFFTMSAVALSGRLQSRLHWSRFGGIYAETFALWMVLFVALSFVVALVTRAIGDPNQNPIVPQYAVSGLSLLAVFWPVLRGVSWSQVRRDIGWTAGSGWFREPLYGLFCYATALPLVGLGLLFALMFSGIPLAQISFEPTNLPAHPILIWVQKASFAQRLHVLILAAVCAPILEETMFRGFFYRHLREATAASRMSVSILFSAVTNSLIFAAIHPQGLLAIPALSAMAFGFSLAREWRGSLIAPITAHAFNNAAVTTALILLL